MFAFSPRNAVVAILVATAALLFTSCTNTITAKAGTPEFSWNAARTSYAAGDYVATVEHLENLVASPNEYRARAVPWALVLTTGMAAGYIDIANNYAHGAHNGGSSASLYRRQASEFRNLAGPLVLQAARLADELDQLPPGSITLSFGRPRGSLTISPAMYKIAAGIAVTSEEAELALSQAIERNVLLSACAAVGAPNDSAKASEILGHASTITPRASFAGAMAGIIQQASSLYGRDQLDNPDKLAQVQARVKTLRAVAEQVGPAMVVKVQ